MNLPTGTVTFLFTDIEGSAKLWEQFPDAMPVALARHDALLRQAIEHNNGFVFKTAGDAFCAVFVAPPDALQAALTAQSQLQTLEPVAPGPSLKVRMALHTGAAEVREGDYFGQARNRVARLLATGHGGQVLLSDVTQQLTRDSLPEEASLLELGEHRLRDLSRSETIFQLLHPALPADFPPLKSLDNPELPNNLPQQLTSFIGREKETAEIKALLTKIRLLTLTGSGGCGKTRLALQVAAEALEDYPDGVWFVELADLTDPLLVTQSVASVLKVREQPSQPLLQTLANALKAKKLLLVLDNCEHVLEAAAALVIALLKNSPNVSILASSREGLDVPGGQTYLVPSLGLPPLPGPTDSVPVDTLFSYEAVRLFADRATLVKSDFSIRDANAPALVRLCHRLDGIPLALELAAARVRVLPVEQIEARLHDRFRLLTGGNRMALPRQQTLRALIDWSYDLLEERERDVLLCLSVFAGGWSLAAAEAVCSDFPVDGAASIESWEVLDALAALVDKSLVIHEEQRGVGRYRLLETVRQYAREKASGEGIAHALRRHRDTYLALVEEARPQLKGPEQAQWLDRLEVEHDNLRAVFDFCRNDADSAEEGLRLAGSLAQFWWIRGYLREGRQRYAEALTHAGAAGQTPFRADALNGASILAWMQGDYEAAHALATETLTIQLALADQIGIANAYGNLGIIASKQGDYDRARAYQSESLATHRALGGKFGIANALNNLGNLAFYQQDIAASLAYHEESLAIRREMGDKDGIAMALNNVGSVAHLQGDIRRADRCQRESLAIRSELGDRRGIAISLDALAQLAAARTPRRSVRLFAATEVLREAVGAFRSPREQEEVESDQATARAALSEAEFAAAWAEGQAMTMEQAIAYALETEEN